MRWLTTLPSHLALNLLVRVDADLTKVYTYPLMRRFSDIYVLVFTVEVDEKPEDQIGKRRPWVNKQDQH